MHADGVSTQALRFSFDIDQHLMRVQGTVHGQAWLVAKLDGSGSYTQTQHARGI